MKNKILSLFFFVTVAVSAAVPVQTSNPYDKNAVDVNVNWFADNIYSFLPKDARDPAGFEYAQTIFLANKLNSVMLPGNKELYSEKANVAAIIAYRCYYFDGSALGLPSASQVVSTNKAVTSAISKNFPKKVLTSEMNK